MRKKGIIILGFILLSLFLIGCQEEVNEEVITLQELEKRTTIIEEEKKAIQEIRRPEQASMFLKELGEQCIQEIDLMFEARKSIVQKLANSSLLIEFSDELSSHSDIEGDTLLNLCSELNTKLLNRGQYTEENLTEIYEELTNELSTKAQEGRARLADYCEGLLSLRNPTIILDEELQQNMYDDMIEGDKHKCEYEPEYNHITNRVEMVLNCPIPPLDYECNYNAYNCADFNTHAKAQAVFEACGGLTNDIHYLDGLMLD